MKTILLAGILALATLTVSANSTNSSKKVSLTTTRNFQKEFGDVDQVNWSEVSNHMTRAIFNSGNQTVYAFFDADGEFIASSIYLQMSDLPAKLRAKVEEASKGATIAEIIEVQSDYERAYFVKINTASGEKIMKGYGSGYLRTANL